MPQLNEKLAVTSTQFEPRHDACLRCRKLEIILTNMAPSKELNGKQKTTDNFLWRTGWRQPEFFISGSSWTTSSWGFSSDREERTIQSSPPPNVLSTQRVPVRSSIWKLQPLCRCIPRLTSFQRLAFENLAYESCRHRYNRSEAVEGSPQRNVIRNFVTHRNCWGPDAALIPLYFRSTSPLACPEEHYRYIPQTCPVHRHFRYRRS